MLIKEFIQVFRDPRLSHREHARAGAVADTAQPAPLLYGHHPGDISERGGGGVLWTQLFALAAIGLAVLMVAVERFKKTWRNSKRHLRWLVLGSSMY
jgi:hypothetical protein